MKKPKTRKCAVCKEALSNSPKTEDHAGVFTTVTKDGKITDYHISCFYAAGSPGLFF